MDEKIPGKSEEVHFCNNKILLEDELNEFDMGDSGFMKCLGCNGYDTLCKGYN